MKTWHRAWVATLLMTLVASAAARGMDPKYLPPDTEIVFTVNWKQLLESDLVKSNKQLVEKGKEAVKTQVGDNPLFKYLSKAGFDIFQDLQTISIANNGGKDPTAVVVEGSFNVKKFSRAADDLAKENADSIKTSTIGDQTVYEFSLPEEKTIYAALLNEKVLVAYLAKDELESAMKRAKATKKPSFQKNEFAVLLSTMTPKQSFSFVATGGALSKLMQGAPVPNGDAAAAALEKLDGLSGAVTVGREIDFQFGVNAVDDATAQKMAQDAQTALPVIQFMVNQQANRDQKLGFLVEVAQTLRVTSQGSNVLIRGKVSAEAIEKIMKSAPQ